MSLRRMRQIGSSSCFDSSSLCLLCVLTLLTICTAPATRGDQPRPAENDVICHPEGCFAVFLQKKIFREAGRSCREGGGTLATLHNDAAAGVVHELLSSVEQQGTKDRFRLWIGLHRAPRQCSATRPLRGFVWVTGDQDGQYTNWLREDSPGTCAAPRCVATTVLTSSESESSNRFRWVDGSCALPLDGYVCQYAYKDMCPPLEDKGGGPAVYTTPFDLRSDLLAHVPAGSRALVPCPADSSEREAWSCRLGDDNAAGWYNDGPSCSPKPRSRDWCGTDHGCEQHCRDTDSGYYCYCSEGFSLDEDGYSCRPDPPSQTTPPPPPPDPWDDPSSAAGRPSVSPACREAGCQHGCIRTQRGVRCTCPPGYQAGPDGRGCADVDECRQQPCPQLCVNAPGTFHCGCKRGYRPDDGGEGECVDVDECLEDGGGGCGAGGGCQNTEGSFTCLCDPGYQPGSGGGGECVDLDECDRGSPCQHRCHNFAGGYRCYCDDGYELQADGLACQPALEDEEYSTLTPDPGDAAHDPGFLPWSTSYPLDLDFGNDPEFDSQWLTLAPGPLPGADDHLKQWDDPSPKQYPTAPPPPQYDSNGNQIDNEAEAKTGTREAGDRARTETDTAYGSGSAAVGKVGAGTGIGAGEAREDGETGAGHGGTGEVGAGAAAGKKKHDKSWLLVALLVPLCVFLVVMLALGIVYCTSCAVDKSQSFSDCYRWILPATPPGGRHSKPQA